MSTQQQFTGWRRSSFCADSACVEVDAPIIQDGAFVVPVRSSRHPASGPLFVPLCEWHERVAQVKSGHQPAITDWFPQEFADLIDADEWRVFLQGVASGDFDFAVAA